MAIFRSIVEFAGPCGINNSHICRRSGIRKVFFVVPKKLIVLARAREVLSELAGRGCLGESNFSLRSVGADIASVPEHHNRFPASVRAAQQTGTCSTVRSRSVPPFF